MHVHVCIQTWCSYYIVILQLATHIAIYIASYLGVHMQAAKSKLFGSFNNLQKLNDTQIAIQM